MKHGQHIPASDRDDDDKAKLAYALAGKLPWAEGAKLVQDMCGCSEIAARALIQKGKRLAAEAIGRQK
jgi:hypothetical protein